MKSFQEFYNEILPKFIATGLADKFELPILAVVGAQSTGKSTLLNNIIGGRCLPNGEGMVTKTPILIQLTNIRLPEKPEFYVEN